MPERRNQLVVGVLTFLIGVAATYSWYELRPRPVQEPLEVELTHVKIGRGGGAFSLQIPLIATEKGFDEEFGIELEMVQFYRAADTMQALLAGEVNITSSASLQAIAAYEQGARLKGIMVPFYGADKMAIVTVNTSGIKRIRDLAGKTVGVPGLGAPPQFIVEEAARQAGIDPDSISLVQQTQEAMFASIAAGHIEAGVGIEPFLSVWMKQQPGVVVLIRGTSVPLVNYGAGGFYVRQDFLEENWELTYRLYLTLAKASWYLRTAGPESDEIVSMVENASGVSAEMFRDQQNKNIWDPRYKPCQVVNLWAVQRKYVDAGKISAMVPPSEIWFYGFYERASIEHPELFADLDDYLQGLKEDGIASDVDFITDWNEYLDTQT